MGTSCHGDSPPWGQPTTRTYRTSHHGDSLPQGHPATGTACHGVACWVKSRVLSLNQQGLGPLLGIGLLCVAGVGTHLGTIYNPLCRWRPQGWASIRNDRACTQGGKAALPVRGSCLERSHRGRRGGAPHGLAPKGMESGARPTCPSPH